MQVSSDDETRRQLSRTIHDLCDVEAICTRERTTGTAYTQFDHIRHRRNCGFGHRIHDNALRVSRFNSNIALIIEYALDAV